MGVVEVRRSWVAVYHILCTSSMIWVIWLGASRYIVVTGLRILVLHDKWPCQPIRLIGELLFICMQKRRRLGSNMPCWFPRKTTSAYPMFIYSRILVDFNFMQLLQTTVRTPLWIYEHHLALLGSNAIPPYQWWEFQAGYDILCSLDILKYVLSWIDA